MRQHHDEIENGGRSQHSPFVLEVSQLETDLCSARRVAGWSYRTGRGRAFPQRSSNLQPNNNNCSACLLHKERAVKLTVVQASNWGTSRSSFKQRKKRKKGTRKNIRRLLEDPRLGSGPGLGAAGTSTRDAGTWADSLANLAPWLI